MKIFGPNKKTSHFSPVIKRTSPSRKIKRGFFLGTRGFLRIFFSRFFFAVAVLLILAGGILYFFIFSDQFLLTEVKVEGGTATLQQEVINHANRIASRRRLFLIKQNKLPIFPKDTFLSEMSRAVPKVKTSDITVKFPHSLLVTITERKQKGIWCNYHPALSMPRCFFYDDEGVIYEDAPDIARGSLVIGLRDTRNEKAQAGDAVLDKDTRAYVEKLLSALEIVNIRAKYISIKGNGEVNAGFFESGQEWEAYFLQENSIEESVENLSLVLEKEIGQNRSRLEYIDLRLGNKVFFRYKDFIPTDSAN